MVSPLGKLSRHGLKFLLYELGEETGIKGLNSEILRHFAVYFLLAKGLEIEEVMNRFGLKRPGIILGHARRMKVNESSHKN